MRLFAFLGSTIGNFEPAERAALLSQIAAAMVPGFHPAAGAVGEYNGKFMVNQYVLRGSCHATPPGHARDTYSQLLPHPLPLDVCRAPPRPRRHHVAARRELMATCVLARTSNSCNTLLVVASCNCCTY